MNEERSPLTVSLGYNPINCDCRTVDFVRLIRGEMNKTATSYISFGDPACFQPNSLNKIRINKVDWRDLLCPIISSCPERCSCRERGVDQVIEVNCTSRNLDRLPSLAPMGAEVELLLMDNKLESIENISLLMHANITKLSLSYNKLENVDNVIALPSSLRVR